MSHIFIKILIGQNIIVKKKIRLLLGGKKCNEYRFCLYSDLKKKYLNDYNAWIASITWYQNKMHLLVFKEKYYF